MLQKHSVRSLKDHEKTNTLVLIKALIIIHPPLTHPPGPSPHLRTAAFQSLLMTSLGTLRTQSCNKSSCNADTEMDQTKESGSVQRDRAVEGDVRDSSNKRPQMKQDAVPQVRPGRRLAPDPGPPPRLAALPGHPGSLAALLAPRLPGSRFQTPCNSTRSPGRALRPPRTASGAKVQPRPHHLRLRREAGDRRRPGQRSPRASPPGRARGPARAEAGPSARLAALRWAPSRQPSPAPAYGSRWLRAPSRRARPATARLGGPGAAQAAVMPVRRDGKRQEPNPAESARAARASVSAPPPAPLARLGGFQPAPRVGGAPPRPRADLPAARPGGPARALAKVVLSWYPIT